MSSFKWYALQAQTQRENKVIEQIKKKITEKHMTEYFGEIVSPETEESVVMNGKRKTVKRKLMPGYILIQMNAIPNAISLVKATQYVTDFIGGAHAPSPLSEEEANQWMQRKAEGFKVSTTNLSVGDKVRVTEGPFSNFNGVVDSVDKDRVKVSISVFGRTTPVDISHSQLVKVKE